jgi:peroxiredoxin
VNQKVRLVIAVLVTVTFCAELWSQQESNNQPGWGRSHHGSHYDEGPRGKPWVMEGIGKTHFPITSSNPEVQKWFDQGHTLLHGFWEFEAERSFRWCLKLDPECAMAYWGMARCATGDQSRERRFFREAVKRKANVSSRERAYIELWEAKYKIKDEKENESANDKRKRKKAVREYIKKFDNLLIDNPDDIEARALYWLEMLAATKTLDPEEEDLHAMRYSLDRVLQEVLAKDPDHVGALHYRVHNWDGEEGHYALDTCLHLSKVGPKSGHLQHMPGHVLSSIGLWNEAAIAMDSATRVEKDYMQKQMVLPEQNWNYIHNLDYLAYIQEQLGMYEAALISCTQLLNGPAANEFSPIGHPVNWSMVRLLVKFEKWEEILNSESQRFRWDGDDMVAPALKSYAMTHALIGLGRLDEAEKQLQDFDSEVAVFGFPKRIANMYSSWFGNKKSDKDEEPELSPQGIVEEMIAIRQWELHGKLAFARGDEEEGIRLLKKAAELQYDTWENDPPFDAVFLYNTLGEFYLKTNKFIEAAEAFEKTLEKVINDGFALSGQVVAYHELDQQENAQQSMARLLAVWKNADQPNRWLARATSTGVRTTPAPNDLLAERNYQETILDQQGHSTWSPPIAPELVALNADGHEVSLSDYRGKNVLLIFYLGGECLHCMEQMKEANALSEEFQELDTEIIAVSKDDLAAIKSYAESGFGVTLLSDPKFANARRFQSFDDFEEIELHSTILIDRLGRIHWSRHGGAPFMDFEFLKNEIRRINGRINETQTSQ